jgi:hypothetical protein
MSLHRLAAASLLAAFLAACGADPAPGPRYAAIVDAGSSGSRIHLYEVTPASPVATVKTLMQNEDVPRGLSWYTGTNGPGSEPANAGPQGVGPLLDALDAFLAASGIAKSSVPVDVMATAGMRLVDAASSASIYASVRDAITASGHAARRVETISGQSEGVYAWADLNYLRGNFAAGGPTEGVVEVGGASAQLAFVTTDATHPRARQVTVGATTYPVFSMSWLGLGQNQARGKMIALPFSGGTAANVCWPNDGAGGSGTYNADIGGYAVSRTGASYTAACHDAYASVIASAGEAPENGFAVPAAASVGGFSSTRFLGLSSVAFAMKEWGWLDAAAQAVPLKDVVETGCSGADAWTRVVARYSGATGKFVQNGCANATYVAAYVFGPSGLSLPPSRLVPTFEVGTDSPTWTRGAALLSAYE